MSEERKDLKLRGFNVHKQGRAQIIESTTKWWCIRIQQTLWRVGPENLNPCDQFYLWYPGVTYFISVFSQIWEPTHLFPLSFLDHHFFCLFVTCHRHSFHWSKWDPYNLASILPISWSMQNNHKTFNPFIDMTSNIRSAAVSFQCSTWLFLNKPHPNII